MVFEGFYLFRKIKEKKKRRRRWARIKVPSEKMISCRIVEPPRYASNSEYLLDDINMAGIAFFCNQKLENIVLKLLVKFPFATYKEAGVVWGRVVYCNKVPDTEKYRIGISYIKRIKHSNS
jgi:hypothetical protein